MAILNVSRRHRHIFNISWHWNCILMLNRMVHNIIWATTNAKSTWPTIKRTILSHKWCGNVFFVIISASHKKWQRKKKKKHKNHRLLLNGIAITHLQQSVTLQPSFCIHQTLQCCFSSCVLFYRIGTKRYIGRFGRISFDIRKTISLCHAIHVFIVIADTYLEILFFIIPLPMLLISTLFERCARMLWSKYLLDVLSLRIL